jgi:hypothetical protein
MRKRVWLTLLLLAGVAGAAGADVTMCNCDGGAMVCTIWSDDLTEFKGYILWPNHGSC